MSVVVQEREVTQEYLESTDLIKTLREVLYPGAKKESVDMILAYCKAAKLDPLLKSLHITQVNKKEVDARGNDRWVKQDVVMPGIGLYRTQAERSNSYIGLSEPEFGEDITMNFDGLQVTYPKWCKITVKRWVSGVIAEYTAKEFWVENYATAGSKTSKPNTMWAKRPYGQLAKCCEAQALRKAFPSLISQQPTSDEMSGKEIEGYPKQELIENKNVADNIIKKLTPTVLPLELQAEKVPAPVVELQMADYQQLEFLTVLYAEFPEVGDWIEKCLKKINVDSLKKLTTVQADKLIDKISEKYPDSMLFWSNRLFVNDVESGKVQSSYGIT